MSKNGRAADFSISKQQSIFIYTIHLYILALFSYFPNAFLSMYTPLIKSYVHTCGFAMLDVNGIIRKEGEVLDVIIFTQINSDRMKAPVFTLPFIGLIYNNSECFRLRSEMMG